MLLFLNDRLNLRGFHTWALSVTYFKGEIVWILLIFILCPHSSDKNICERSKIRNYCFYIRLSCEKGLDVNSADCLLYHRIFSVEHNKFSLAPVLSLIRMFPTTLCRALGIADYCKNNYLTKVKPFKKLRYYWRDARNISGGDTSYKNQCKKKAWFTASYVRVYVIHSAPPPSTKQKETNAYKIRYSKTSISNVSVRFADLH